MEDDKSKLGKVEQQLDAINKRFDDLQWVFGAIIVFFGIVVTANSGLAVYLFKDQGAAQQKLNEKLEAAIKDQKAELKLTLDHASDDADKQTNFVSGYVNGTRSDFNNWIDRNRQDSKEFRNEVDSKLNQGHGDPQLEALGPDNRSLDGGTLDATNVTSPDEFKIMHPAISFELRLRNSDTGSSGEVSAKAYSNEIPFPLPSDDFAAGQHSAVIYPDRIGINKRTSNVGIPGSEFTYIDHFDIFVQHALPAGQYRAHLKIYFGERKSLVKNVSVTFIIR